MAAAGRQAKERLKAQALEQARIHRVWAANHPERARDERQLRIYNSAVRKRWDHKRNGTPETHAKAAIRDGAIARLYQLGDIDAFELGAAVSIATTHARITGDVTIRTVSYETRIDSSGNAGGTFFEKLGAVRAEVAYSQWRLAIANPSLVLAIIVDDLGITAAANHFGMRREKAKKLLLDALHLWDKCSAEACKKIDHAELAAAQAGIL